jgi:hypothetical protein
MMKRNFKSKLIMAVVVVFVLSIAMSSQLLSLSLKTPKQISPKNNSHFTHYPRKLTLRWSAVRGAASYDVEIDCLHCRQPGQWDSQNGPAWKVASDIKATHYSFTFVGDNKGRWRVRASRGNLKSRWSRWWYFDFKTGGSSPGTTRRLPDLIVRDIRLLKNCKIQVTIANIGTAGVPSSYYDNPNAVAVQMYKGSQPWGGMILSMFDPAGKLKSSGGVATHVWFPLAANLNLSPGTHSLKVTVDIGGVLTELDETNNSLTRRVSCKKAVVGTIGTAIATLRHFSISNIRFSPASPASLNFNDKVKIWFDYKSSEDVHIWARPMTKGSTSPGYAAHGSPLYPKGSGNGEGYFTITKGKVTVDQVRFQMMDKTKKKVLHEKLVPVKYTFPKMLSVVPGQVVATIPQLAKAPKQLMLDFTDAYLVFTNPAKSIQIAAQNMVLSYGSDWEKCQLKPYLYHIRQNFWKGFYWKVNTSKKEVYEVTGGTFCKLGGSEKKLNIKVDVVGGSSTTPPDRFMLRFSEARLVYEISSKTLQLATGNKVLSYCQDFQKCNLTASVYHFKENFWQGFYWKVDTTQKKVWKVSGTFCQPGGGGTLLNIGVRVFN